MPRSGRLIAATAGALVLACAALAYGQQIWVGGWRGYGRYPPRWAAASDFDGGFIYCRGYYTSRWREQSGSGWNTDYPGADNNFSVRLMELTTIHVKVDTDRQPNYVVVSLSDPLLYHCPMLFMEDIGTAGFSDQEVVSLREFFLKGGFLWVDDSWGSRAWSSWVAQISRILPPSDFPISSRVSVTLIVNPPCFVT